MSRINGIPALGFGTFGRRDAAGIAAMTRALEVGYRHLDTAQVYENERETGEAIARATVDRDEVFVTTKIGTGNFGPGKLVPSLRDSLDKLRLEQVDLTLIHWPSPHGEVELGVYLEQLAEARRLGLTDRIGVSNFPIALIDEAIALLGPGEIATNQVELHPYLQNRKLARHCRENGIAVTCYQPIAKGRVNDDQVITEIAAKHGATPVQVTLAWELAQGYIAIPTSSNDTRIAENFAALELTLDETDMERITGLDRGQRFIDPDSAPDWD